MNNKTEFKGNEALEFIKKLKKISIDQENWNIIYLDEKSGEKWILDYPDSSNHGGGQPRIRKLK